MVTFCCAGGVSADGSGTVRTARRGRVPFTVDVHCHIEVSEASDLMKDVPNAVQMMGGGNPLTAEVQRRQLAAIRLPLTDIPTRLSRMDKAGIDVQALSPSPNQYYYNADAERALAAHRRVNDRIAEVVARHPDRFVGMGTVPLQAPDLAVSELRRAVQDLGLRGVEIGTNIAGEELAAAKFEPFFSVAEELEILIFLHPMAFTEPRRLADHYLANIIGNPLDSTIAASQLIFSGMLERHPRLKICIAHGGGFVAAYAGRMDHAYAAREDCRTAISKSPSTYLSQLYFDTVVFAPDQLEYLVRKYGADHVLLGSDYPYDMAESDPVGFVQRARLTSAQRAAVLGQNAAQLLGIPTEQRQSRIRPDRSRAAMS